MSKEFFKGRQDKRENHTNHGYQSGASHKPGSQKHPLQLTVTSDERKAEIEVLLLEHELFGSIIVNSEEDAEENIFDLTGLLNKPATVSVETTPSRNDPCSCGSGKKYKKCCG
ncbi:MAG: SWIM/SEC-C metal-binding protein [Oceanicoccus sp.]|jgi:SWIM/SEC-C metal-binding protein